MSERDKLKSEVEEQKVDIEALRSLVREKKKDISTLQQSRAMVSVGWCSSSYMSCVGCLHAVCLRLHSSNLCLHVLLITDHE